MKLVAILKLRDEADVLEANLRHHRAQGVDFFIATDNGSVDGTLEILTRYQRAGLLHLIESDSPEFESDQGDWFTQMARLAASEFGADWVLPTDADEFWWPLAGDLRHALASVPSRYGLVSAPRPELVPRPEGPGSFAERLLLRETVSRLMPKTAHRAGSDVVLAGGGHHVRPVALDFAHLNARFTRPVLRGLLAPADRHLDDRLVPAPCWPLRLLHVPFRSYRQFVHRVELVVGDRSPRAGQRRLLIERLEELHRQERLGELYRAIVCNEDDARRGLEDGRLVIDTSLRDSLARAPDPLAVCAPQAASGPGAAPTPGGSAERSPGAVRPADDPDQAATNRWDAMRAQAGVERLLRARVAKQQRQIAKLEATVARQRDQLAAAEAARDQGGES